MENNEKYNFAYYETITGCFFVSLGIFLISCEEQRKQTCGYYYTECTVTQVVCANSMPHQIQCLADCSQGFEKTYINQLVLVGKTYRDTFYDCKYE